MPGTVTVACKLPHGLILQLYKMEEHDEPIMAGGFRKIQRAVPERASIKLNGSGRKQGEDAPHEMRHGAGLTFGVDADFFAEWMKRNAEMEIVKNGLIFAQAKGGEIEAQARDHKDRKTGLERLDPKNLPQEFRGKIETAPAAAA